MNEMSEGMKTSDYSYGLPEELIAQDPLPDRSSSRLMVLHKDTGKIEHRHFYELPEYLEPGDCLVLNNTKVIPARLIGERVPRNSGTRPGTKGMEPELENSLHNSNPQNERTAKRGGVCEILLLKRREGQASTEAAGHRGETNTLLWECLVRPGKRMRPGDRAVFGGGLLTAEILEILEDGIRLVRFSFEGIFEELLDRLGLMPLPPYIHNQLKDRDRYQTVYAKHTGSAAAPTAGLHFTPELLDQIRAKGVDIAEVTLHVGLGTFRPVKEENILEHEMHTEWYHVPAEAAEKINRAKAAGKRVICVGTTSCRTVESAAEKGPLTECSGSTSIFIYPGYRFRVLDALVTNFHLPESTLIMLVSALAGRKTILAAYEEAVRERYRFFSFGDAMLIV